MENLFAFYATMTLLGKIEFIVFVGAMFFYIRNIVIHPEFVPHPVAFGIWLIADIVNYITYISFSEYWVGPLIMPLGAAITVALGTVKLIRNKNTTKITLGRTDVFAITISILSLLVYCITGNGKLSNIMIQLILFMGFVPLVTNLVTTKRTDEPLLPWILFFIGWVLTCGETLMGYTSPIELIYPFINGLVGCGVILGISFYNKHYIKS